LAIEYEYLDTNKIYSTYKRRLDFRFCVVPEIKEDKYSCEYRDETGDYLMLGNAFGVDRQS